MSIIRCKLNVSKVEKSKLFKGEKGVYMDITLLENRDGPDEYGNNFMVVQDLGKESREAGVKNPILGNGKYVSGGPAAPAARQPAPSSSSQPAFKQEAAAAAEDDLGF